jgi:hypothetical protein
VGSVVGQIAKIKGCRVIGIAGGPELDGGRSLRLASWLACRDECTVRGFR